jgi:hypothetical protein
MAGRNAHREHEYDDKDTDKTSSMAVQHGDLLWRDATPPVLIFRKDSGRIAFRNTSRHSGLFVVWRESPDRMEHYRLPNSALEWL